MTVAEPTGRGRSGVFSSLRHRNYLLLWTGTLISHTGDWLDQIALNWLVLEQTGSAFYLGMVNLCRGMPILLFTLIGGAVADRMERRRLMMLTQGTAMGLAVLLAVMVLSGNAPLWGILVIATMRGSVIAFNLPARHSLIPMLVPREDLPNAVALNSMTMNVTKVLGPVLSGLIIAAFGTGACFALNAVSFVAVLWTLAMMRFPPASAEVTAPKEALVTSIFSGLRFVRSNRVILLLVLVSLIPTFFAQPYIQLLAIFAYDVFQTGPVGLGILTASAAFGSVFGALVMAGSGASMQRGSVMLALLIGCGVSLAGFAANPSATAAPFILFFVGALFMAYNATHATLLQLVVPDIYRGRVLSTLFLNRGIVSLGTAGSATIASVLGARAAYGLMATGVILFGLALLTLTPVIRRLRP